MLEMYYDEENSSLDVMRKIQYNRPSFDRVMERVSVSAYFRITAITGPRQVGKTTIALQVHRKVLELGIKSI